METQNQPQKELCTVAFYIQPTEYDNWLEWVHSFLKDLLNDARITFYNLSIIEKFPILALWSNVETSGIAVAVEFSILKTWETYTADQFRRLKSREGSVPYLRYAHRIFGELEDSALHPQIYSFCGTGRVHAIEYSYKQLKQYPELADDIFLMLMNSEEEMIRVVPREIRLIEKTKGVGWIIEVILKHLDLVLKLYFDSPSVKVGRYSLARIKQ